MRVDIGSPLGELSPQVTLTEGCFRVTSHITQKIPHKNPSTSFAGFPSPFRGGIYSGSLEKGAGSRRLTEGFFRKALHIKQKIPRNPSTSFAWSPFTPKGAAYLLYRLPFRAPVGRALC